jgi:hypothetical protein
MDFRADSRCEAGAKVACKHSNGRGRDPQKRRSFGEIDVCGVGKVKLDRDDWTATGRKR